MGWDKGGRYYTRSKKVNGRVVREYFGTGRVAELVARMDAIDREEREHKREAWRAERAELDAFVAQTDRLNELADLMFRVALLVAGFRRHNRGEWRKQRGRTEKPN